jgi:hypothetical protein
MVNRIYRQIMEEKLILRGEADQKKIKAKKKVVYKDPFMYDDFEVLKSVKACWDRGIYFYPEVMPNQGGMTNPKVKIGWKDGSKTGVGKFEYKQNQELYDKMYELYIHKHKQFKDK